MVDQGWYWERCVFVLPLSSVKFTVKQKARASKENEGG